MFLILHLSRVCQEIPHGAFDTLSLRWHLNQHLSPCADAEEDPCGDALLRARLDQLAAVRADDGVGGSPQPLQSASQGKEGQESSAALSEEDFQFQSVEGDLQDWQGLNIELQEQGAEDDVQPGDMPVPVVPDHPVPVQVPGVEQLAGVHPTPEEAQSLALNNEEAGLAPLYKQLDGDKTIEVVTLEEEAEVDFDEEALLDAVDVEDEGEEEEGEIEEIPRPVTPRHPPSPLSFREREVIFLSVYFLYISCIPSQIL